MKKIETIPVFIITAALCALTVLLPSATFAHCDGLDGPVVTAAQKALESGNVNPVLIWVQKKDEQTIKDAFQKTLAVRKLDHEGEGPRRQVLLRDPGPGAPGRRRGAVYRPEAGRPRSGSCRSGRRQGSGRRQAPAPGENPDEDRRNGAARTVRAGDVAGRNSRRTTSRRGANMSRRTSNTSTTWSVSTRRPRCPPTATIPKPPRRNTPIESARSMQRYSPRLRSAG